MKLINVVLTALLSFLYGALHAESNIVDDQTLLLEHLQKQTYDLPSSTAITLYEKCYLYVIDFATNIEIEKTIKVLGPQGFSLADISIPLPDNGSCTLVEATTYNIENGVIVKNEVLKKDRLQERVDEHNYLFKTSLPNVKEGSIIHFKYKIYLPFVSIPDWYFQDKFPKLYSIYEIFLQKEIVFTTVNRTAEPMSIVSREKSLDTCTSCEFTDDAGRGESRKIWVRRNIPALEDEPFTIAKENYLERIKVWITSLYSMGYSRTVNPDWKKLNDDFFMRNDFLGSVFKGNGFLDETLALVTQKAQSPEEKARAIFAFMRDSFSFSAAITDNTDSKEVFKKRRGNIFGINKLLIAMLIRAGLECEPVLVATTEKEQLNEVYTNGNNMNWLVALLKIGDKAYLLDASDKYLKFGQLNTTCYNGMARTVSEYPRNIYLQRDNLVNKNVTILNATPAEGNNSLKLAMSIILGEIESHQFRSDSKGSMENAIEDFEKNFNASNKNLLVKNIEIQNLRDPELPLKISITATLDLSNNDIFVLNPFLVKFIDKNPFSAEKRFTPVTFDYLFDETYVLSLTLPPGYKVDDFAKSSKLVFEESPKISLENYYQCAETGQSLKLRSKFTSATTHFGKEDYGDLKSYFDQVVQAQQANIVIKKTSSN